MSESVFNTPYRGLPALRAFLGAGVLSHRYTERADDRTVGLDAVSVDPTPATHAILTQLKAGDTEHQAGELPKTH